MNTGNESETPRTDAEQKRCGWPSFYFDFARQLERELNELQARFDERTAAYEKKDAEQVRKVQELERGEYICRKCGLRKDAEYKPGDF